MPKRRVISSTSLEDKPALRPAITPEGREMQLINLAMDLVEQRLRDGTASAQETTHVLKLGSIRNQLEVKKLEKELNEIPLYVRYMEHLERVNQMINYVKDELNDYFYHVLND